MTTQSIKEAVKEKYGQAALRVQTGADGSCATARDATTGSAGCCTPTSAFESCCDPITVNLYDAEQAHQIPYAALQASLGCGNPTALAQLNVGEIVLDLGSGGGIDVLLSARRARESAQSRRGQRRVSQG
jgi:hypothetical protein